MYTVYHNLFFWLGSIMFGFLMWKLNVASSFHLPPQWTLVEILQRVSLCLTLVFDGGFNVAIHFKFNKDCFLLLSIAFAINQQIPESCFGVLQLFKLLLSCNSRLATWTSMTLHWDGGMVLLFHPSFLQGFYHAPYLTVSFPLQDVETVQFVLLTLKPS